MDEELRFHVETRTEAFVRKGFTRDDALSEALRRLGVRGAVDLDTIRQQLRRSASRREDRMKLRDRLETVMHDVRYALRGIRARPGFTAAVVLTLALGIGATTAMYSVVQAVLLSPLPYRESERTVMVWNHWTNWPRTWLSQPEVHDYAAQTDVFESFAAYTTGSLNLTSGDGDPERLSIGVLTPAFFDVTGVRALAGRVFTSREGEPNGPRVVLISEALWSRRFADDRGIIGKTIDLSGNSYVDFRMPLQFAGDPAQAFLPLALGPANENERGSHGFDAIARLRAGVTLAQAQRRMTDFIERFKSEHPNTYGPEFGIALVPLADQVRGDVRPVLLVLLGAVSFVLLIACANVANLLLSRAESRHREIAVRAALGASHGRIAAQLLTESVVLGLAGGAAGLLLATWLARGLSRANLANLPRVDTIAVDGGVLAFAFAVSVLTGLLFGLAPVVHVLRGNAPGMLKQGRGNTGSRSTFRVRTALVALETMLAVVATAGALVMGRSFARLVSVSPGFVTENALTFRVSVPQTTYRTSTDVRGFYAQLLDRLRALPGVRGVGAITALPLATQLGDWGVSIEGFPPPPPGHASAALDWQTATPGYLEAMRIPVLQGRGVTAADRRNTEAVVVINEAAEKKYFTKGPALGTRIMLGGMADSVWRRVVGVTRDVRHAGVHEAARPQMYIPYEQFLWSIPDSSGAVPRAMTVVLRTAGEPATATSAVRGVLKAIDADLPLAQVRTLEEVFARSVSTPRVTTLLLASFGLLALLLSTIGVYGVTSYAVTRRTNEIGIRVALGARVREVVSLIVVQGMRPAIVGAALGVGVALLGMRLMRKLLYDVSPTDPVSLALAALILLAVGLAANWLPARRAAKIDPVSALRAD
jgi:putative ABC transport system permease protein